MRVVAIVLDAGRIGVGRPLVGRRGHDRADQALHVEPVLDEVRGDRRKQLLVRRGVGRAQVVDRMHETAAEQAAPHAVHDRARELRVVGRCQPCGDIGPPVLARSRRHGHPVERAWRQRDAQPRMQDLSFVRRVHERCLAFRGERAVVVFHGDAREQVRELVVVALGPLLHRVVVAPRARERQAEKRLRVVLGDVDRIPMDQEVIGGAHAIGASRSRRELADEAVPGRVGGNRRPNPVVERSDVALTERPARHEQHVGPLVRPEIDELRTLEQRVHEPRALVGCRVGEETAPPPRASAESRRRRGRPAG